MYQILICTNCHYMLAEHSMECCCYCKQVLMVQYCSTNHTNVWIWPEVTIHRRRATGFRLHPRQSSMFKTSRTARPTFKPRRFRSRGRTLNEPQKWHKAGSVTSEPYQRLLHQLLCNSRLLWPDCWSGALKMKRSRLQQQHGGNRSRLMEWIEKVADVTPVTEADY